MNVSSKKTTINNITLNKYQQNKFKSIKIPLSIDNEDYNYNSHQPTKVSSKFNQNGNSDIDTIYINNLSTITNEIQNNFINENDYLIYCKYLEGKKLGDLFNEDYKHNNITFSSPSDYNDIESIIMEENNINDNAYDVILRINRALSKFNKSSDLDNFSKLSENMLNAEIVEVCHTDSGYDSFVLKDVSGNYMIINSCTNDKSLKDILAISYPLCKYLTGSDDFIQIVFDYLVNNADLTNISQDYFSILESFDSNHNLYQEQVNDNLELIEKYCNKAKSDGVKVDLYGYSLGGGIQETAYAKLIDSNNDIQKYIQSISVYNPFTLCAEEYQDNFIDLLANDKKLCIYSAQQDFVSTFNDSVEALLKKTVYLKADDIEANSVNGIGDVGGLIIGSNSNHGFAPLDKSAFDENGNISDIGEFISINTSIKNATGETDDMKRIAPFNKLTPPTGAISFMHTNHSKYKPNYQDIFNDIFNSSGVQNSLNKIEAKEIKHLINDLVDYFGNNFGQIKYEEISSILSDNIADIISDEVNKTASTKFDDFRTTLKGSIVNKFVPLSLIPKQSVGGVAQVLFDENDLANSIDQILNSKEGKDLVLDMLSCYLNNDIPAYNRQMNRLIEAMIYIFGKSGNMFSQIRNGLFTEQLKSALKSKLQLDEPQIEVNEKTSNTEANTNATIKKLEQIKNTSNTETNTNSTVDQTPITTTTADSVTTTTTTTTTTATPTTPAVTTAGIAPSNMPPLIAYDPLVVEILGYPKGGHYTTTTTVSSTTTVRE